ncbi:DUF4349 domain-containing protein [Pseudoflavonifractor phocaeensis]|uniref:DUF4349 domain-containing protein n=1 Tax=Pseudoflavonifractor phocaeensis TaxID=1870988 RepID=UPI001F3D4CBA|nr:DUF4349 domain-containing protein [Pseudoflavonifractor phocaeensis]MCF2662280.1 DUF4349 domain-containing protein [Pseudoflavonifractor phocaeensis]
MKRSKIMALSLALLLLAGCGGGRSSSTASATDMAASSYAAGGWTETAAENGLPAAPESAKGAQADSPVYRNAGAKLIRRAELCIQTTEFDQTAAALDQLVVDCGGYYESASVYGGSYRNVNGRRSGEYVVRIPAEKFTQFQSSAGGLGYVTSGTESSEDVGEQYYDAESRLKTQRTKQERLLSLLEKADNMEDIISLENALSEVEYQIEQYSSQLNRYDALISYSTFTIYLDEVVKVTEEVGETASLGQKMAAGLAASGEGLVQGFQDLLVWFSYHIFGVVFLAAAVSVVVIAGRRLVKKKLIAKKKQDGEE